MRDAVGLTYFRTLLRVFALFFLMAGLVDYYSGREWAECFQGHLNEWKESGRRDPEAQWCMRICREAVIRNMQQSADAYNRLPYIVLGALLVDVFCGFLRRVEYLDT